MPTVSVSQISMSIMLWVGTIDFFILRLRGILKKSLTCWCCFKHFALCFYICASVIKHVEFFLEHYVEWYADMHLFLNIEIFLFVLVNDLMKNENGASLGYLCHCVQPILIAFYVTRADFVLQHLVWHDTLYLKHLWARNETLNSLMLYSI